MMHFCRLTVIFCLLIVQFSQAQRPEEKVEESILTLYQAMVDKDMAILDRLTATTLSYGHSNGLIENKTQYIEAVMHGSFDYITIKAVAQTISISGDTAIVRHIFETKATNDGTPTEIRLGCLLTFQEQGGEWKLLARQAFKL